MDNSPHFLQQRKYTKRREKKKQVYLVFYSEPHLYSRFSANIRTICQKCNVLFCFLYLLLSVGALYLLICAGVLHLAYECKGCLDAFYIIDADAHTLIIVVYGAGELCVVDKEQYAAHCLALIEGFIALIDKEQFHSPAF